MISDFFIIGFFDELEKIAAAPKRGFFRRPIGRNLAIGAAQTAGGMAIQYAMTPSERKARHDAQQSGHELGEGHYR